MSVVINVLSGKHVPEDLQDEEMVVVVFRNPDAPIFCTSPEAINTAVARLVEEEMKELEALKPKPKLKSRYVFDDDPQP
jgi:hypothetical protein